MKSTINRRELLGGGMGMLGAAAVGPAARATEDRAADQGDPQGDPSPPDVTCWARPLAQESPYNAAVPRGAPGDALRIRASQGDRRLP
jgi:hypothetical protein